MYNSFSYFCLLWQGAWGEAIFGSCEECSPPVRCSQGGGNMAPYEPYPPQNPPQRHNRGFGMTSSYSRSRRQMQCVNKECQYGFVPENGEEPQGPEETITFYEIEGEDDTAFPTLPVSYEQGSRGSPAPIVHGPSGFWVARRGPNAVPPSKQTLNSSEEEEEPSENGKFHEEYIYAPPDPDCETATVFSSAEPTANLVLVNSAAISTPAGVYAAPATGFSSNSAASTPASVTTAVPPQTAVQPVVVSPLSLGRPAVSSVPFPVYSAPLPPVSEVGEAGAVLPPYSCDPSGSDLPRDTKVLRYYFNLGLQYYHQSYWPSMVYVQPVPPPSPVEVYPAYAEPAPVLDQSVPQLYTDAGRTEVHQVPLEAPANGNFQNAEPPPLSYGPVYYPVVSDPFSQQSLPGFDSLVPAYRYISTWHPVNPPYGNSPQIANAVSSGPLHQVSYIASPNPAPHDMPQGL
ncbi:UDP-N-acetylglucosamine transferase subunit ALG13-like [Calonectris borealis]|uniref:UDP-N-acetylglucosamine transferase subunit ALG13-like n=1 Tax=Calonectris borealis TaxID=1323832 RepID=UPI003F4BBFDA